MFIAPASYTRSNSWIVFGAFAATLASGAWASRTQFTDPQLAYLVGIAGFSLPFFAVAFAQVRSGYFWRNLSPGNRGQHRSDAPVRFVLSNAFFSLLGIFIIAYAVWIYFHPFTVPHAA